MVKHYKRGTQPVRWLMMALCVMTAFMLYAKDGEQFDYNGIRYKILSEAERTISTAYGPVNQSVGGKVTLPESVMYNNVTYKLVEICANGFSQNPNLEGISIPGSVQKIGDYAFWSCTALKSISLPGTVTDFGQGLFAGCTALKTVELPEGMELLPNYTFNGCTALESIDLPNSIVSIGEISFYCCTALKSVKLPSSLRGIGDNAFSGSSSLGSINFPNTLETIGYNAFAGCNSLKTITIPKGVKDISTTAFAACENLTEINVDAANETYSSESGILFSKDKSSLLIVPCTKENITIPSTVKTIGGYALYSCTKVKTLEVPSSVTTIGAAAFANCTSLSSIKLPDSVTEVGENLFSNDTSLTSCTWSANLKKIPEDTFQGCSSLASFIIPGGTTLIEARAFKGCTSLKTLTIPASVIDVANNAFDGCELNPLRFDGDNIFYNYFAFEGLTGYITCPKTGIAEICKYTSLPVVAWDEDYQLTLDVLVEGVKFTVTANPEAGDLSGNTNLQAVIATGTESLDPQAIEVGKECLIKDLKMSTKYILTIAWKDKDGNEQSLTPIAFATGNSDLKIGSYSTTQTSITIEEMSVNSDESYPVSEYGVSFDGKNYPYTGKKLVFKDLMPATTYNFRPYLIVNDNAVYGDLKEIKTKDWGVSTSSTPSGPTVVFLKANYNADEVTPDNVEWSIGSEIIAGKNAMYVSLNPETTYTATFTITYKGQAYKSERKFTTAKLELTTLTPKCVSQTCAIVAAQTNVSDYEPQIGFQWKKYDAPASLAPAEGYGAVCDGVLEGYIKNLQSTSYYNVRPFYKSGTGEYFYGEWVTFDPSDFSFFEPTVRTYPVQEVTETSARVRGYALAGTDNIKRQGFQYWKVSGAKNLLGFAPSADQIMTVTAQGQVMSVTFTDLEAGTTYAYRAFVETESGNTYGDEETFTTEGTASIYDVESDVEAATVVGYYDLMGRRYNEPFDGINIVLYSDGTSKKVIIRK